MKAAERRTDPLTGQEVLISPGRAGRPHGDRRSAEAPNRGRNPPNDCPLCPGNEYLTPPTTLALTEGSAPEAWSVRVIPNLYPIVSTDKGAQFKGEGRSTSGVHEVVVETRNHDEELADRRPEQVALLLKAFQKRLGDLERRPGVQQVQVFKNRGVEAGTSLDHPHSQIVTLDFVPNLTARQVRRARRHYRQKGGCLLCTLIEGERLRGDRLVSKEEGFVAMTPYASAWAGEVALIPLTHRPSFTVAAAEECDQLARNLIDLLGRIRAAFDDPPYNLILHTAPVRGREDAALHWYWQLTPRLTRQAGLEVGTGLYVNPLPPEDAASLLREA